LSADSFGVSVSLTLLAFAYLGGITSVGGALVAGALAPLGIGYVVLDRNTDIGQHYLLVSGILLVATAVLNPGGIAGTVRSHLSGGRPRLTGRGRRALTTPSDPWAEAEPPPVTAGAPT
ncbi:MAG: branched-chain amino acid ABC transporter permease/ATP-binding protein, partial [Acidimicrobiales bacterium]